MILARWTKTLIIDIRPWAQRKFGEVDYFLTQFLTGHGGFGVYLKRFHKQDLEECENCRMLDTVEHAIFNCNRWVNEKRILEGYIGRIDPKNIIAKMLKSEINWELVKKFITKIMSSRK